MAKGSCHGCGCETPSDCCWYCSKCVGNNMNSRLIEMAIAELEQVPGGKLYNPRVLTAIGCLMSLRANLIPGDIMPGQVSDSINIVIISDELAEEAKKLIDYLDGNIFISSRRYSFLRQKYNEYKLMKAIINAGSSF